MSLKCPKCAAKMGIIDSRSRPDSSCYRRYKCLCGFKCSTEERIEYSDSSKERAAKLEAHKQAINDAVTGITNILRGKT